MTGLLDEAAECFRWSCAESWMVGDKFSDVELGRRADLGAILVRTGYGAHQEAEVTSRYDDDPRVWIADDLADAVAGILARGETEDAR